LVVVDPTFLPTRALAHADEISRPDFHLPFSHLSRHFVGSHLPFATCGSAIEVYFSGLEPHSYGGFNVGHYWQAYSETDTLLRGSTSANRQTFFSKP
jgi:hypothetical protein